MLKVVYPVLAVLALLFAALVSGWDVGPHPSGARAAHHGVVHHATSIDDDDDDEDEAPVASMLAPDRPANDDDADADGEGEDAAALRIATAPEFPMVRVASLAITCRGLRPAGEHRAAADRPPRA